MQRDVRSRGVQRPRDGRADAPRSSGDEDRFRLHAIVDRVKKDVSRVYPRHTDARYEYGLCLARLGRPAEAEQAFRQVLKEAPTFRGAHHGLAAALQKQGKRRRCRGG